MPSRWSVARRMQASRAASNAAPACKRSNADAIGTYPAIDARPYCTEVGREYSSPRMRQPGESDESTAKPRRNRLECNAQPARASITASERRKREQENITRAKPDGGSSY